MQQAVQAAKNQVTHPSSGGSSNNLGQLGRWTAGRNQQSKLPGVRARALPRAHEPTPSGTSHLPRAQCHHQLGHPTTPYAPALVIRPAASSSKPRGRGRSRSIGLLKAQRGHHLGPSGLTRDSIRATWPALTKACTPQGMRTHARRKAYTRKPARSRRSWPAALPHHVQTQATQTNACKR